MRLVSTLLTLGLILASGPGGAVAQQSLPDVDQVLDHLDDLYRSTASHARMRMTVERERGTREMELESWSKGEEQALIVIRAPAREAGAATLRTEEGLWNYAPRADRLIRIPSGLLSDNWMGSHFTNDDLLRETSYREDYEASLEWAEEEGERRLRVVMTPLPEAPVVYTRLHFLLTPGDWIPLRWDYLDQGEVVRSMHFHDVEEVDGRPLPMRLLVVPADAPEEYTEIVYLSLELDISLDDDLFTRQGLRRVVRGP